WRGRISIHLNHRKNEILRLIEGRENFILCYRYRFGPLSTAFYFNEAKFSCPWDTGLNIVAALFVTYVARHEAKPMLGRQHRIQRQFGDSRCISGKLGRLNLKASL